MGVTYVDIEEQDDVGQRVDNYLMRVLKGVPRQHVYRILRKGEVRINGGRVKATYRLQLHDRIRIPPVRTAEQLPVQYSQRTASNLLDAVVYEDADYLVVNKPPGMAVHGGSGINAGVVEILRELTGNARLELVHRLDRDTSGCLALAKHRRALQHAQLQFRHRRVKKIYQMFVAGAWPEKLTTVQLRLKRYETSSGERRVRVDSRGQQARTDFAVLDRAGHLATWLQASLHTGRTHQIRVHTSSHQHAILGDDKYTPHEAGALPAGLAAVPIGRLCLHASKLEIPLVQDALRVTTPIGDDLVSTWQALKRAAGD
jgi:23S rRNA pseudouridine955/2504/2580 synthase